MAGAGPDEVPDDARTGGAAERQLIVLQSRANLEGTATTYCSCSGVLQRLQTAKGLSQCAVCKLVCTEQLGGPTNAAMACPDASDSAAAISCETRCTPIQRQCYLMVDDVNSQLVVLMFFLDSDLKVLQLDQRPYQSFIQAVPF